MSGSHNVVGIDNSAYRSVAWTP